MNTDLGGDTAGPPSTHPLGWQGLSRRMWARYNDSHVSLFAAGAAFFGLLALVPALAAIVAIYGAVFDSASAAKQAATLSGFLPAEAQSLLQNQLTRLTRQPSSQLGFAAALGFLISLWSASSATKALMEGLNEVYRERETRSVIAYNATASLLTLSGLFAIAVLLGITLLLPLVLTEFLPAASNALVWIISYAILIVTLWLGISVLYRYAPCRVEANWRWLTPGAISAVAGILGFSIAFSWFARTFSAYSTYGSIGAVIGFMTWSWVSMLILLVGAQLDAETEYQISSPLAEKKPRDTTG